MNNSVKPLIVILLNEGHQGLLKRYVPSAWGGLVGMGWKWGIFKRGNLL